MSALDKADCVGYARAALMEKGGMLVARPFCANREWGVCVLAVMLMAFAFGFAVETGSALAAEPTDNSAVAKDARLGGDLARTRFVADLSAVVDFRAFTLSDPYRVIVDMPEVKFLMPSGVGAKGKGLVNAFRFGLFAPGKSRIVIDTVEPVKIDKAFLRKPENGQPARLVLDLVRTSKEEFEKQRDRQAAAQSALPSFQTQTERADRQRPDGAIKKTKSVIVIDPGHGGVDPGAISAGGIYEKNVVFAFAQVLKAKLEATGRFKVVTTRDEDIFIPLADRVEKARTEQADLLISVHADALDTKHPLLGAKVAAAEVRGASIYTVSEEASDDLAKAIAARENRSDALAGVEFSGSADDDLANILIDLMYRETKNLSVSFAKLLLTNLKGKVELTGHPHRFANFKVLKAQDVPSVLIELGYLSHGEDERALTSDEWRSKVADAIVESVKAFFAKHHVSVPG
jgi:N-acetylmuramoyl-L-alanine amidase